MKICSLCKKNKALSDFNFKNRSKGLYSAHCKTCSRAYIRKHYLENRQYYLDKARKRNKVIRMQIRTHIWNYLSSNCCIDCGENDPVVLEFDHVRDKKFTISSFARNHTLKDVSEEIAKCEVRCANCHRRRTAKQFGYYKDFLPL